MSTVTFSKQIFSISEHLTNLQERGLLIPDPTKAEHALRYGCFYRLLDYAQAFIDPSDKNRHFFPQTRFEDILAVHEFDSKLHSVIWEALSRLKISLMTQICRTMAFEYGEHWYLDPVHFSSKGKHAKLLKHIRKKTSKRKRAWAIETDGPAIETKLGSELLTVLLFIETWDRIFLMLTPVEKKRVAEELKLEPALLASWLENLIRLKELLNRHARLWDRYFEITPLSQAEDRSYFSPKHSLYAQLSMMQICMRLWVKDESWSGNLKALLEENKQIPIQRMGFPDNWAQDRLWI